MTKADKLRMCVGCRDNFYNGNNNIGVKECWMLNTAKVITRTEVGTWQTPPYVWTPVKILSCYNKQGSHFLQRSDSRMCDTPEQAKKLRETWDRDAKARQAQEAETDA